MSPVSELIPDPEIEVAHTAAIIEDELRDGFLAQVAESKVEALPEGVTPREVAEIILPEPKSGESLAPRWTLVAKSEANAASKAVIADNGERIISTAEALELRKIVYGERQPESAPTDGEHAVFVAEGGANKTSVVRRGVAIKSMHETYGDDLSEQTLYQFGSGRTIAPTKEITKPGGSKETIQNPEHQTIRSLAGEFLPENSSFTEFEANLATALADGYEVSAMRGVSDEDTAVRKIELTHPDTAYPKLVLIQPGGKGGLSDGFTALKQQLEGKQLVMATNGQYREKDKYQAELWAQNNGVDMIAPVAIGDEPGDRYPFRDSEVVVPNRAEAAYVNELIILWRLAMRRLPDVSGVEQ